MKGVSIAMDKKESTNKLIMHLNSIINHEVEKPYTEMDADLVEACVELSLELQGKNYTLSNEELEEKVRKIPFVDTKELLNAAQKKRKITKKKILLIAAIVAILCAILMVMSSGRFVDYWHSVMNEKFGSVFNVPVGEEYSEGNEEFVNNGKGNSYKNIDDFFENEKLNVLIPTHLPDDIALTEIYVNTDADNIMVSFNSVITDYTIMFDKAHHLQNISVCEDELQINNITCHILRMTDIDLVQIYFEHNGNFYSIGGTDEQILLNIVENLEENNEN